MKQDSCEGRGKDGDYEGRGKDGDGCDKESEDEAIYDTVAPDENEDNSRSSGSNLIGATSTLATSSTEYELIAKLKNGLGTPVSEIDLASHFTTALNRDVSNSNLSLTAIVPVGKFSSSVESSFANYVNIDYFLRRDETASSKNDSDDAMSRSVSSDHEDLSDGRSIESYGSMNDSKHQRLPPSSSPSSALLSHTSKISAIVRPIMSSPGLKGQMDTSVTAPPDPNPTYDEVFHDPDLYGKF